MFAMPELLTVPTAAPVLPTARGTGATIIGTGAQQESDRRGRRSGCDIVLSR